MRSPGIQTMKRLSSSGRFNGIADMGRSSRSVDFRFSATAFQHNIRVGIALVPCSILLLGMGGKPVLGTLTVGLMVSYILDALHFKHAPFFGIWGSLFASQLALILARTSFSSLMSLPVYCLALLLSSEGIFLIGVWGSLQFRWLQLENPTIVLALERILFACIPFIAAAIQTWGIITAVGITNSPFYLMLILFELYWLFALPQQSSFKAKPERSYGGHIADEALILGPLDGAFHTVVLLFLPLLFYIGIHHAHLFSSVNAICEMLLLFFVPLLFQLYASAKGALWWLAKDPKQFHHVRLVNGAISLFVVIACVEVRVIFHSFAQYIQIPPPWSYLFVSIALLGGAVALGAYGMGLISDAVSSVLLTGAMMLAFVSGSLVVGLPFKFLLAPVVSAFYVSHFCMKKSFSSYFIFAVAASLPVTWFVVHNFWFLNVWLGGVTLKTICKLLIACTLLALAIPGLVLLPLKIHLLADAGLISYAVTICLLENRLHSYSATYYSGLDEEVIYPGYVVILTTAVGLLLVRRLTEQNRINSLTSWVLTCLYCAKISVLLLLPRSIMWPMVMLMLVISPPVLLYRDRVKGASRMKPWKAFAHAGTVCIAVWVCRRSFFETVLWFLGRPPSDCIILGTIVSACAVANIPLVARHFSHIQSAKRALVLVFALGICLLLLQPPVPSFMTKWWRPYYITGFVVDDLSIYGARIEKPGWPSWLLLLTIVISLAAFTSTIPIQHIVELRLFYAAGVGFSLGVYICTQYFMQAPIIHALIIGATISSTIFMIFTHLPSASSPRYMPWVFALLVALLPIMYFVEGQSRFLMGENEDEKFLALLAVEGSRASLLGLYACIFILIALQIKLELVSLVKEKIAAKGKNWIQPGSNSEFVPKYRLLQIRPSLASPFTVKKLGAEGSWMPAIGNVATCLCFALCLILNIWLTGGSNRAIFVLAPILLLLNQDSSILKGFTDRQRYFPLTMVISVYLVMSAGYRIWEAAWHGHQNAMLGLDTSGLSMFFVAKNALLLLVTIPNQLAFNLFMWNNVKQPGLLLLLLTPLNIPAVFITDISTVQALALSGIVYALTQYMVSRHVKIAGMKLI